MKMLIYLFILFFNVNTLAAQLGTVVVEETTLYGQPQADGTVLGTITKDAQFPVSNVPTNGFYKARMTDGTVGWVSGSDILATPQISPSAAVTPAAETAAPKLDLPTESDRRVIRKKKGEGDHSRIILGGGLQFLDYSGIPAQIVTDHLQMGYGVFFEIQFKLATQFHLAGRLEFMGASSLETTSAGVTQELAFKTFPLMGGLVYSPFQEQAFRLGVGAYLGMAFGTSLSVTQQSITTTFESSDFCGYFNAQGSYRIGETWGLYGEMGYRFHNPTYPTSSTLNTPAFATSFSGPVFRTGIDLRF